MEGKILLHILISNFIVSVYRLNDPQTIKKKRLFPEFNKLLYYKVEGAQNILMPYDPKYRVILTWYYSYNSFEF